MFIFVYNKFNPVIFAPDSKRQQGAGIMICYRSWRISGHLVRQKIF